MFVACRLFRQDAREIAWFVRQKQNWATDGEHGSRNSVWLEW